MILTHFSTPAVQGLWDHESSASFGNALVHAPLGLCCRVSVLGRPGGRAGAVRLNSAREDPSFLL